MLHWLGKEGGFTKRLLLIILVLVFAFVMVTSSAFAVSSVHTTDKITSYTGPVRIGLTWQSATCERLIRMYGGQPVYLPKVTNRSAAMNNLRGISAILLPGGGDINPRLYGSRSTYSVNINDSRDLSELCYCNAALSANMPILGVCRGCQMLNVASGGSLYQDIGKYKVGKAAAHAKGNRHAVKVRKGTKLYKTVRKRKFYVKCYHHQCILKKGRNIVISAKHGKVIEAIERKDKTFAVGVQFHIETLSLSKRPETKKLMKRLIAEGRKFEAKRRK